MADRQGTTIRPGDACVLFQGTAAVGVTVLRVLGDGDEYLVQLNPRSPRSPDRPAIRLGGDHLDAMVAEAGLDVQEPMVVPGSQLQLEPSAEAWGDEDEDD